MSGLVMFISNIDISILFFPNARSTPRKDACAAFDEMEEKNSN
jgi:hypothetical protein